MDKQLTLGSLFSGSGGFELAGMLNGIKPVWLSEIEPFASLVTAKRFPNVTHYGDISTLNGADLEPVDIITWGSPCQDLSISGKRAGLSGARSGLYLQAVRIVKEMLEATSGEYPRYCVFENVPGLLSSNNGEDFKTCLDLVQELGFIPDANFLDAQYMGLAQRRKRVFITWVNVEHLLSKRTITSDSIILQLLTEILRGNLAGLLAASGIERKGFTVLGLKDVGGGLLKRIKLFSLQKEDRLAMLQKRLDDVKAKLVNEQDSSASVNGIGQMENRISTGGDMRSENLSDRNQSMSTELSWKSVLDDSYHLLNEFTTSIWTRETIIQRICFSLKTLLDTLDVTSRLIHSLMQDPICLNYFEWVTSFLIEIEEFINAAGKYEKSFGELEWHDMLGYFQQQFRSCSADLERNLRATGARTLLFEREGVSRYFAQGFDTWERAADDTENRAGAAEPEIHDFCLNVQGNSGVDITEGVVNTLVAQSHGHEPCVLHAAGFCTEHSANSRSIGYEEEVSPTLRAGVVPAALSVENHPADGRVGINEDGKAQTLTNRMGTGGLNVPLVAEVKQADQPDFKNVAFGLCSKQSHSMLSDNPHSGFYEAQTARTLDKSGGSPLSNQGGIAVVSIQGSMIGRAEKNGPQGSGVGEDVSFTLDVADRHGVAYAMTTGSYTQVVKDRAPTLQHRDWKDPPVVTEQETPPPDVQYVVRRLTPTECAVLQGFPRWYCSDIAINDPTEEQIAFWTDVWQTYSRVTGEKKPKSRKQVISWLAKPYSDSAEYKIWGNGLSLPVAVFVLGGITELAESERGTD